MAPPRSVNLSALSGRVEVEPDYHVELPDTEYFILVAGGNYPAAATRYDHPNVAARQDKVFLTRSYWPNGRKRWCQHAGRDFYFVIPRDRIALVFAKGYSYVPVIVNGRTLHLNVSGGTCDDGWTDFVRQQVSVGIQFSKQKLDLLAEAALPPEEARGKASLELAELSAGDCGGGRLRRSGWITFVSPRRASHTPFPTGIAQPVLLQYSHFRRTGPTRRLF